MTQTDLTFFTNDQSGTLLDRFRATLAHVQLFDILVGYFRTSGFHLLQDDFEPIEKIRILVGLNVDRMTRESLVLASVRENQQLGLDFSTAQKTKDDFAQSVVTEMNHSEDRYEVEVGVRRFVEYLRAGKIELKAHPSQNIHAKVYISRFPQDFMDYGRVITGSSNFSHSGLAGQYEFNVELKDRADVDFALTKFEELWAEAIDLTDAYVETIQTRTWLNDQIDPYQLYLKFLYEYFLEDINIDLDTDFYLPDGFIDLEYQKQAVVSARKILEAYGGVFLADVVGLGKTYIAALLAQQLPGRKLVICPPVLVDYWRSTFVDFGIGGAKVESMGKLDQILRDGHERFDYVFVDEAHRFRNESTQGYEKLHQICWGKKVVLVSATPLNNTIDDIFTQIKLFQPPRRSAIPGVTDLEGYFRQRTSYLGSLEKGSPEYLDALKEVAGEVRQDILSFLMVRRTRREIVQYYDQDMANQGLSFPELADPSRIVYEFDPEIGGVFEQTIELLKIFRYARYTPLLYLKKQLTEFERQSQRNVGGFMKGILVKRLESSFHAFRRTLGRFIDSYEQFIEMVLEGTVYISRDVNVYELLENDDEAVLLRLVEAGKAQRYESGQFVDDFIADLQHDLQILQEISDLWRPIGHDPKRAQFVDELKGNPQLKDKKALIFTESAETGRYLFDELNRHFPGRVLFFSSGGGIHAEGTLSVPAARQRIKENFDPRSPQKEEQIRLLITTDVLAEGINLHRSNIVINYDLPWNPTRVLQRVGRVNRVGTAHQTVHIFNFFPTSQADEELGLEANIKGKIQAFHDVMGEDAKYLTDEEEVTQHGFFGDQLLRRLSSKESYEGEAGERSELEYLQVIRDVRDNQPDRYTAIKRLPKKARSGRAISPTLLPVESPGPAQVISFFRLGRLKKFFLVGDESPQELTFMQAADLLRCDPATPRLPVPPGYYDQLAQNRRAFEEMTGPEEVEPVRRGSRATITRVTQYIRAIRKHPKYTDQDERYVRQVLDALDAGIIPEKTLKGLKDSLLGRGGTADPIKALGILRAAINPVWLNPDGDGEQAQSVPIEVILSEHLQIWHLQT